MSTALAASPTTQAVPRIAVFDGVAADQKQLSPSVHENLHPLLPALSPAHPVITMTSTTTPSEGDAPSPTSPVSVVVCRSFLLYMLPRFICISEAYIPSRCSVDPTSSCTKPKFSRQRRQAAAAATAAGPHRPSCSCASLDRSSFSSSSRFVYGLCRLRDRLQ